MRYHTSSRFLREFILFSIIFASVEISVSRIRNPQNIVKSRSHLSPNVVQKANDKKNQAAFEDSNFWRKSAQEALTEKLETSKLIENQAKNVVFYLGDGMSVPTITAARIFKGQQVDGLPFGEEGQLHMDTLPHIGTSKTFCSDAQVADSACSSTAYLCGVKSNFLTIGVSNEVQFGNCSAQSDPRNHVSSVLAWAQASGKSTGIITSTTITHASPAGTYAHIASRGWENDARVKADGGDPTLCEDIAKQLILREPGININVIMGGGRLNFLPNTENDPESGQRGNREDGLNLIDTWKSVKNSTNSVYVTGRDQLDRVNTSATENLLGLFAPSHIGYLDEQLRDNDPSLEEMVKIAIQILSKNPNGFFLFVEGGRIDEAHHYNLVQRALWETIEFDKAIKRGDDMTLDTDTLVLVTADHSQLMHFSGYPPRGNPILTYQPGSAADDGLPFTSLGYANGPGQAWIDDTTGKRHNITGDNFHNITYRPPSPIPIAQSAHGGDDVLILSKGPFAHLLTGVQQQSYIPHAIAYAACIGDGDTYCKSKLSQP